MRSAHVQSYPVYIMLLGAARASIDRDRTPNIQVCFVTTSLDPAGRHLGIYPPCVSMCALVAALNASGRTIIAILGQASEPRSWISSCLKPTSKLELRQCCFFSETRGHKCTFRKSRSRDSCHFIKSENQGPSTTCVRMTICSSASPSPPKSTTQKCMAIQPHLHYVSKSFMIDHSRHKLFPFLGEAVMYPVGSTVD